MTENKVTRCQFISAEQFIHKKNILKYFPIAKDNNTNGNKQ